ncbi:unnamed protein product [Acanthoscelides obtectus]|uniref:Uncharacterized protein n=1 Tax=Acanthoscelides obtectus TaxID=200917 RepID=A0A9P0LGB3_ACAOB|nr:unnamed protein product [Acanthoscelides obtectus]CAK1629636.1 hypothetical protein AOBTE_LOCUS5864 [Acanthoscelides obtectus]
MEVISQGGRIMKHQSSRIHCRRNVSKSKSLKSAYSRKNNHLQAVNRRNKINGLSKSLVPLKDGSGKVGQVENIKKIDRSGVGEGGEKEERDVCFGAFTR